MIIIPPLSDLLRNDASDTADSLDVGAMMQEIFQSGPILGKTQENVFASRPGRGDMSELLAERYQRFTPVQKTKPAATTDDLGKMVAGIVAEQMKAANPSTMGRPRTTAAPAAPTSPAPAVWAWSDELGDGEGIVPRENVEPPAIAAKTNRTNLDADDILEKSAKDGRERGIVAWLKKELAGGETVDSLAEFATKNGQLAQAELIRKLAAEI